MGNRQLHRKRLVISLQRPGFDPATEYGPLPHLQNMLQAMPAGLAVQLGNNGLT